MNPVSPPSMKRPSAFSWNWKARRDGSIQLRKHSVFRASAYITASYAQLYFDWCEARGIQPTGMRF